MSEFHYAPLYSSPDWPLTRFVELYIGEGLLRLSLFRSPLSIGYEALSYVWGDPSKQEEAYCDGARIYLTANLSSALRHLRPTSGKRLLWIDAICINQADNEEKAQQIRLMGQIYERATRVLVWLGEADQYTEPALNKARDLWQLRKSIPPFASEYYENGRPIGNVRPQVAPLDKEWMSFDLLFTRPWFSRVWIIQEVFVNREAVPRDTRPPHSALFEGRKDFQDGKRSDLASNVCHFQDFQATNPRDKIFALLGLIDAKDAQEVAVHYDASVEDVYMNWTISCLSKDRSLDVIGCVTSTKPPLSPMSKELSLPSWVPDWSQKRDCFSLSYHQQFSAAARDFRASPKPLRQISAVLDGILTLRGHTFSEIKVLGMISEDKNPKPLNFPFIDSALNGWFNDSTAKLKLLLNWEAVSAVRKGKPYVTGESIVDAYWQTLCAGCIDEDRDDTWHMFIEFDKGTRRLNFLHHLQLSASRSVLHLIVLVAFLRRYIIQLPGSNKYRFAERMVFAQGRRMTMLSNCYIGLVPRGSRKGDQVWLLEGGKVPFVLRKTETGESWLLVGEAYIHGIMEGEAFNDSLCK